MRTDYVGRTDFSLQLILCGYRVLETGALFIEHTVLECAVAGVLPVFNPHTVVCTAENRPRVYRIPFFIETFLYSYGRETHKI